ncbi:DUF4267 domain-containing protein [Xanthocytophaga agilis]|uniref:DUF4267 domain-containing protein n=1 Tax=Xanthocytophaga agilis TaxID=3048010 RepID=A0AAE3R8Q1_9BACT|nr:DUF4267 domain-containing protein [Xanthocytophaga agilis]MDJ1503637.1 DUF4267 domain-containing protein [Xanthocytophaga agilis]
MKTENVMTQWGLRSLSYWMTLFIALGILFIGLRFILLPRVSVEDFGIQVCSQSDLAFGRIKGIRDMYSGLALLALLLGRMKKATAYVFTAAIIIPCMDCLQIYLNNGLDLPRMLVHGLTAVYMIITSFLLFSDTNKATS